ncbi:hypothetical protein D3C81_1237790 [compost metagenome]
MAVQAIDISLQILQQRLVQAAPAVAEGTGLGLRNIAIGHAQAGTLAVAVVVQPEHLHAGALQYIEQTLVGLALAVAVVLAGEHGEHARHRYCRGRAA